MKIYVSDNKSALEAEILSTKIQRLITELIPLGISGARVVGSRSPVAIQKSIMLRKNISSDVDIHVLVEDKRKITRCAQLLQLPQYLDYYNYDIIASKILYLGELFSVHIYSPSLFKDFCSFRSRPVKIFRTSRGKTNFTGYGVHKQIAFYISMQQFHDSYISEYMNCPMVKNALFMLPYQTMAMSGITIIDGCNINNIQRKYARSIARHLIRREDVYNVKEIRNIFGHHLYTVKSDDLSLYEDIFLDELKCESSHMLIQTS